MRISFGQRCLVMRLQLLGGSHQYCLGAFTVDLNDLERFRSAIIVAVVAVAYQGNPFVTFHLSSDFAGCDRGEGPSATPDIVAEVLGKLLRKAMPEIYKYKTNFIAARRI